MSGGVEGGWWRELREKGKKTMSCVQPFSGSAETLICMQYARRRRKMKAAVPSSRRFQPFALGACVGISINARADIAWLPLFLSPPPSPPLQPLRLTRPHLVSDVATDE